MDGIVPSARKAPTIAAMITLYGIPNCDTVKKARTWLNEHGVAHAFHDFRKQGVSEVTLNQWIDALGWEPLLNRKGTTWRGLEDAERTAVIDAFTARTLMEAKPSLIKRPVVQWAEGVYSVGFSADKWLDRLSER
jgi:arsenate reductase (glutaredoxin)